MLKNIFMENRNITLPPSIHSRPIASLLVRLPVVVRPLVVVIPRVPREDLKTRVISLLPLVPTRVIRDAVAPRWVVRWRRRHIRERCDDELGSLRHRERRMCFRHPRLIHHRLLVLVFIHDGAQICHLQAFQQRLETNTLPETVACIVVLLRDEAHHLSVVVDATINDGRVLRIQEVRRRIRVAFAAVLGLLHGFVVGITLQPAVALVLVRPTIRCYAIVTPGCRCGPCGTGECSELGYWPASAVRAASSLGSPTLRNDTYLSSFILHYNSGLYNTDTQLLQTDHLHYAFS
jgi:hypothetical protein